MKAAEDAAYPVRVYLLRDDMLETQNAKSEGAEPLAAKAPSGMPG